MEFKHIIIIKDGDSYIVRNKHSDDQIGSIFKYKKWKCWVYEPENDTLYSKDCLQDITKFIDSIEV